jgi:hypothetical protein
MTNRELITKLSGLLVTLAEVDGPAPASHIYLAFGSIEAYYHVTGLAERAGWVKTTPETVSLTPAGKAKAKEIEAAMAGSGA